MLFRSSGHRILFRYQSYHLSGTRALCYDLHDVQLMDLATPTGTTLILVTFVGWFLDFAIVLDQWFNSFLGGPLTRFYVGTICPN